MIHSRESAGATVSTSQSAERKRRFALQRIDSQKSLVEQKGRSINLGRLLGKINSGASMPVGDLKSERRAWRHKQEKHIHTALEGKDELHDSSTMMESSTTLDYSSVCSKYSHPEKRVSFSVAEYREYNVTVDVSHGGSFPMTLDWDYSESKVVNLCNLRQKRRRPMKPMNIRKRQQRLLTMGIPRASLVALERRRQIQLAGEWAFGSNAKMRPAFAFGKILQYSII